MDLKFSLFYIIPMLFILLIAFPIFVELRASFNPLYNRGVIALFIFKKQIFYFQFSLNGKYITIQNQNGNETKKLEFSSPEVAVVEEFLNQLKDKIRLKRCFIFYNIGLGDAFNSAMVCGLLNQVLLQMFLVLKSHKPTASLCVYDTVSYNKVEFELAGDILISVSFFEIAYSYLYSVILTKKKSKTQYIV